VANIDEIMLAGTPAALAPMLGSDQLEIVNAAGVDQASATPLTVNFALIETPANDNGVRLGWAAGAGITALLNIGPQTCLVWPAEDDALNAQAPNEPIALLPDYLLLAVPSVDQWLVVITPADGEILEAPVDGQIYGRRLAGWVALATTLATTFLPLAGGAMAGPIVLPGAPSAALQAVTKAYVDAAPPGAAPLDGQTYGRQSAAWAALASQFLPLAGGSLTGPLVLPGPPTAANQAATKAYVDETSSGVLIDWFGTGTANDNAIWTSTLNLCASLGIPRIYAARPSNVANLYIKAPIEIVGLPGFSFNWIAGWGSPGEATINIQSGNVTLRNITVNNPRVNWRTSLAEPPGYNGILVESSPAGGDAIYGEIVLDNVTVNGGVGGITFSGGDRITMRDCEVNGQWGMGVILGGGQPMTKVRVDGLRAVSCGLYGFSLSDFGSNSIPEYGDNDIEVVNACAINCGKFATFTGADGGTKLGFDITTNSLRRYNLDLTAIACGNGGVEIKVGGAQPGMPAGIPIVHEDGWAKIRVILDEFINQGGDGVTILEENPTNPAGDLRRLHVTADVSYRGSSLWAKAVWHETGDFINNGGQSYICLGDVNGLPGLAGTIGPPAGTGTFASSFYDGNLYWHYSQVTPAIPCLGARGVTVETLGTTTDGLTVDARIRNCAYGFLLIPVQNDYDTAIRNLHIRSPVITNCAYGIYDGGNSAGTATGIIQVKISNPVIEVTSSADAPGACAGIMLGAPGNGSTTGPTNVTAEIIGGRIGVTGSGPFNPALQFNGGTVALTISGDTHFMTDGSEVFYAQNTALTVNVLDATFHSTVAAGRSVFNINSTCAGVWNNYGNVKALQPDATQRAWVSPTVSFNGSVIRGVTTAAPTTAGALGEVFKLSPETAAVGRYVCTTAGAAGGAVWTAKI
jgi:hypothetical protein